MEAISSGLKILVFFNSIQKFLSTMIQLSFFLLLSIPAGWFAKFHLQRDHGLGSTDIFMSVVIFAIALIMSYLIWLGINTEAKESIKDLLRPTVWNKFRILLFVVIFCILTYIIGS